VKCAAIAALAVAAIAITALLVRSSEKESTFDAFWGPAFHSSGPVMICINDQPLNSTQMIDATNPVLVAKSANQTQVLNASNVSLVVDLTRMLRRPRTTDQGWQAQSRTTFGDLRSGPARAVGAYTINWTLKMTAPLRFHFTNNPDMSTFWIEDRQTPQMREWSSDVKPGVRIVKGLCPDRALRAAIDGPADLRDCRIASPKHGRMRQAAAFTAVDGSGGDRSEPPRNETRISRW